MPFEWMRYDVLLRGSLDSLRDIRKPLIHRPVQADIDLDTLNAV